MNQRFIKNTIFSGFIFLASASYSQEHVIHPDAVVPVVYERTSKALNTLPQLSENKKGTLEKGPENEFVRKGIKHFDNDPLPGGKDPALQTAYATGAGFTASSVQILSNWQGLTPSADPSDNTLSVGPSHVVQMVNGGGTAIRIYNKSTGAVIANTSVSNITGKANAGDPSIVYDYQADRYVLLVISSINGGDLTICVSKTNNPSGQYYVYTMKTGGLFGSDFPDYPKLSVWGGSYFVTTNASGPYTYALDRENMLTGTTARTAQRFKLSDFPGGGVQACSPVYATGSTLPPANSNPIILRLFDAAWTSSTSDVDVLELYTMNINWTNSSLSTMSGPVKLTVNAFDTKICNDFNSGTCISQKNTSQKLDAIGSIVYDKAQYRNFGTYESIVCTYMVDGNNNNVGGMRWYELRRTGGGNWTVFQQGTYAPNDNVHRWMGSISINSAGNIALGYNVSGSTLFPGIRVTGRSKLDAGGLMTAAETIVQSGTNPKTASNRYGDYNAMLADPTDGSFWFSSNYNPSNSPKTNIVHFKLNSNLRKLPIDIITSESLNAGGGVDNFELSPNPAKDKILLRWKSSSNYNMPVQFIDLQGRVLLEKLLSTVTGDNNQTIELGQITTGTYFIKCHTPEGAVTQQLIIQ